MAAYSVLYDACVLYPAPLRDLLLRLAMVDLFRARWTETILDECFRNLLLNRPDLQPTQLTRTRELMNAHVLDALITGHETLIQSLTLAEARHLYVLAEQAVDAQLNLAVQASVPNQAQPSAAITPAPNRSPTPASTSQPYQGSTQRRTSTASPAQIRYLRTLITQRGLHEVAITARFGIAKIDDLRPRDASVLIDELRENTLAGSQ